VAIHLGRREFIAGLGGVAIGGAAAWTYTARARDRVRAENTAYVISQFIGEIESQVGWTLQLPLTDATLDQHRFDGMRLLRQSAAITDVVQIDSTGKEPLHLNRGQATLIPNDQDYSQDPRVTMAMASKVYFGPLNLRREPSMTLALAGTHRDSGVTIVEVGLQLVWDVVTRMKVGERGQAYVIDPQGRLIAHSDISLVLRNTDMTQLAQVRAARTAGGGGEPVQEAKDLLGRDVLTASALVASLGWLVFVELPVKEANTPLGLAFPLPLLGRADEVIE
jgi:two-component system NtrC family sensor kinase